MKNIIKVLMCFPTVGKAVVQGESGNQYVVDYVHQSCMCGDYRHRHKRCKHISHVLDQLMGKPTPWELPEEEQAVCDVCEKSKSLDQFHPPGHLSGGQDRCGFDIDSCVCIVCAIESKQRWQESLGDDILFS